MWWAGSKPFDVYLGTRAVAACGGKEVLLFEETLSLEAGLGALSAWCASAPTRSAVRVWLSGGLCRPFLVPPVAGVKSHDERWRVAASMAAERTGLIGELDVWLDEARHDIATLAVALDQSFLPHLQSALVANSKRRLRLASLRPWWADVLRAHAGAQAVAVKDCDSLTLLMGADQGFELATTVSPVLDEESGRAALSRLLLSSEVDVQSVLQFDLLTGQRGEECGTAAVVLAPLRERVP